MDIGSALITLLVGAGVLLFGLLAVLPIWFEIATRRQERGERRHPRVGPPAIGLRERLG